MLRFPWLISDPCQVFVFWKEKTMNNRRPKHEKPVLVVTHEHPDTDAWLCVWLLMEHYAERPDIQLSFVRAGERLPDNDEHGKTHEVIHVDTGGGKYDQHGKGMGRFASSFQLVAEDLDKLEDPAVQKLLPLSKAADAATGDIDPTSIHYFFTALPFSCSCKQGGNKNKYGHTDWGVVLDHVLFALETMANKWRHDAKAAEKFKRLARIEELTNGVRFCPLNNQPGLRKHAYTQGANVTAWTAPQKGGFYPAVQVGDKSKLDLSPVVAALRAEEARVRHIDTTGLDLSSVGKLSEIPGWFLHDTRRLVGCGTRTHPLSLEEMTKIKASRFFEIVRIELEQFIISS